MAYLAALKLELEDGRQLSTAEILVQLDAAPSCAKFDTAESALYIGADPNLMGSWRRQGRGPAYEGSGHYVRYRKSVLDEFMRGHEGRIGAARDGQPKLLSEPTAPAAAEPAAATPLPKRRTAARPEPEPSAPAPGIGRRLTAHSPFNPPEESAKRGQVSTLAASGK
jgi:hypothetical protein